MEIDARGLTDQQLRSFALQALKNPDTESLERWSFNVAELIAKSDGKSPKLQHGDLHRLRPKDLLRLQDIQWDFVVEGIIRFGLDPNNRGMGFFRVTEWGRKVVNNEHATPYDPEGYLAQVNGVIPKLDSVVMTYLAEALKTFRTGCHLSSMVMLGCASERAIMLLIDQYVSRLPTEERRKKYREKNDDRPIKHQFDALSQGLKQVRIQLPHELRDILELQLDGIFTSVRITRNDAGHPSDVVIERDVAYPHLLLFPSYLQYIYGVMNALPNVTIT